MRTIIRIQSLPMGDGVQVQFTIEEPTDVPNAKQPYILTCDPQTVPFSDLAAVPASDKSELQNDLVKMAGEQLLANLREHPGVQQAINSALNANGQEPWPILFEMVATDAEALPWEALYDPGGEFLSLDARWPIARLTGAATTAIERRAETPVRAAAVLAAADRDATPEWLALLSAIQGSGLACDVLVLVSTQELEDTIENQGLDWVSVERVPSTDEKLVKRLAAHRPHFLHFFCHGSSSYAGFLEIATPNFVEGLDPEPLYLAARQLNVLQSTVWLATIDACEGAAPADSGHSIAYSLVNEGMPAAIGMREEIESTDASVFCGAFYKETFSYIGRHLQSGARFEVPWAVLLRAARTALCDLHPGPSSVTAARHKQWSLPVLYQRPADFVLTVAGGPAANGDDDQARVFGQLAVFRNLRDNLPASTPQDPLDQLEAMIAHLEAELIAGG